MREPWRFAEAASVRSADPRTGIAPARGARPCRPSI